MAPGISYDDSGSLAAYFGVTFLAVALVPTTWAVCRPAKRDPLKPLCQCSKCQTHRVQLESARTSERRKRFSRRIIPLLLGWLAFAYLSYRIAIAPKMQGGTVYDPFEILGISSSLDERGIKKHYKKLSLQFHPDKIKLAINQTMEEVESKFVELTKAYKALTDEVTRENLAKYGNPDGPQQREDKIAIPQWVVEGKNSIWVLAAYGLLLGGGIPWIVGRWWFRQRRTTRDNVLNGTAEHFFHSLKDDTDFVNLITIFSGAKEFSDMLDVKVKSNLDKKARKEVYSRVEELEKALESRRSELGIEENPLVKRDSKVAVGSAGQREARALIWAHLLRYDLDKGFAADQQAILKTSPPVLAALANISQAHGWLKTSLLCLQLQAALAQGLALGASPLTQLPGYTFEKAEEVEVRHGLEGSRWMERFVSKAGKAGEKSKGEGGVEASEEAVDVARNWPRLEVSSAEFKVEGEKVVPPSSIVNLVFKVRYTHPTPRTPKANGLLNGDVPHDKEEGEQKKGEATEGEGEGEKDGLLNGVRETVGKVEKEIAQKGKIASDALQGEDGEAEKEKEKEKKWAKNGYAHAPYWPGLRKPHYSVLLGDSKLDKVIVPPIRITDIPLPSDPSPSSTVNSATGGTGAGGSTTDEPSIITREFKLTFPAPPQPNLYSFVLHFVSDTFIGNDIALPVLMKVEEPPALEEIDDDADGSGDGDISEPEEDSLAGQMALMKGGKVKRSPVRYEYESSEEEEESDEDEDEDGEGEGESDSDDEQGPNGIRDRRKGKAINEDTDSDDD